MEARKLISNVVHVTEKQFKIFSNSILECLNSYITN